MEILSENSSGNNNVFAEGETINKGIDDYEVEWDNDRSYRPTINFILNG